MGLQSHRRHGPEPAGPQAHAGLLLHLPGGPDHRDGGAAEQGMGLQGGHHCGTGVLEVVFTDEAGKEVARNASPFNVEPGKFTYRLVRGELTYETIGTVEAHCRIDQGPATVVPLTLLPPLES